MSKSRVLSLKRIGSGHAPSILSSAGTLLCAVSVVLVCLLSGAAASAATSAKQVDAEVEKYVREKMRTGRIPGLEFAVVRHGKVVKSGAYGIADLQSQAPVKSDTIFPLLSITKAFGGVAIMQLVEAGKVDLDAPVSRYLDGLPSSWQAVTVRQLATHTSGLPSILKVSTDEMVVPGDVDGAPSWEKVQQMPLEFAPGAQWHYNLTNYLLLGRIIDKLAGQPFEQFITQRQLLPAGMTRTAQAGFTDARDVVMNSARSYSVQRDDKGKPVEDGKYRNSFWTRPRYLLLGNGISSTADELARWVIALQNGTLLEKRTSLDSLWEAGKLNDGCHSRYALGWPTIVRAAHRVVDPTGGGRTAMALYPQDDIAVIVLTNLQGSFPENMAYEIAAMYVPDIRNTGEAGCT